MLWNKMVLVLSAVLLSIWIVGFYGFHTSLNGYLHLLPLLSVNCALSCLMRKEKRRLEDSQGTQPTEETVRQQSARQLLHTRS
ncbi:MAG: hypothetical protein MUD08_06085 [Cytophagales bacterium]|jgi:hypothetical protein|nr:hypothetical protein [Cytophagales bacterium]